MTSSARRLAAFLACAALFLPTGCQRGAKTFTVNLSVPARVGEKSHVVTTSSTSLATVVKLGVGDQTPIPVKQQNQNRVVRLEADVETLAVFPNGSVQKAALTLRSLRVTLDDQPETEVLPAGTKIVAEATTDGQVAFQVNGQPAADDVAALLRLVFEPGNPARTDQEKLGPKSPVEPGAAWPIDAALFAGQFQPEFGDATTCSGTVRLDGVSGEGDHQVAAVSGAITLRGLKAPLPDPFVTKSGEGHSLLRAGVTAAHVGTDTMSMSLNFKFVSESPGPGGGQFTATIDMGGKRETSVTYH
jgi:hypothetical protein